MEGDPPDSEDRLSQEPGAEGRCPGENPGLLLTPPRWMKSVIRVCAAVAAGLVIVLSVAMWSHDAARLFWVAWNEALELRRPLLTLGDCYPTPATLPATVALVIAAYHCIQLHCKRDDHERGERVLYIAAAHSIAVMLLCLNAVSAFRYLLFLSLSGCVGYFAWFDTLLYIFWRALPNVVLLVLTIPALGKYVGLYFSRGAWLLHMALLGIAATVLAIQLFLGYWMA